MQHRGWEYNHLALRRLLPLLALFAQAEFWVVCLAWSQIHLRHFRIQRRVRPRLDQVDITA